MGHLLSSGLMVTSSMRAQVTGCVTPGAPPRAAPLTGGSEAWLRLWVLVLTRFLFAPSAQLWWVRGLILNVISPFLSSCWDFSFALGRGVSFFGGIQHSPVDGCSAVSCNFRVLTGEDERTSFYFAVSPGEAQLSVIEGVRRGVWGRTRAGGAAGTHHSVPWAAE